MVVIAIMDLANENDSLGYELRGKLVELEGRVQIDRVEGGPILGDRPSNPGNASN